MDLCAFFSTLPHDLLQNETYSLSVLGDHAPSCYKISNSSPTPWIIDSGASYHMTPDASKLCNCLITSSYPDRIQIADGSYMKVNQTGCVRTASLSFPGVLHIPDLSVNLLSVSQLADLGYEVVFSSTECHVQDHYSKKIVGTGRRLGGIYVLMNLKLPSSIFSANDLRPPLPYKKHKEECHMIEAKKLSIAWGNKKDYWKWTYDPNSRFPNAVELLKVCYLDIRGRIATEVLSLHTTYEVYLVYKLTKDYYGLENVMASVGFEKGKPGNMNQSNGSITFSKKGADLRKDGWMEINFGTFFNEIGEYGAVELQLKEVESHQWKSGLIVAGIDVRSEKALHNWYSLTASELTIAWAEDREYWKWKSNTHDDSRSSMVVELLKVCWLDIRGKIDTKVLYPWGNYVVSLVFKLTENAKGLFNLKASVGFAKDPGHKETTVHLVENNSNNNNTMMIKSNIKKYGQLPRKKMNGWMEIELGEFSTRGGYEGEVEMKLLGIKDFRLKSGLVVWGIQIRPREER